MIDDICIYNIDCNIFYYWLIRIKFSFISLNFDNGENCFLTISFMICCDNCNNKKFKHQS